MADFEPPGTLAADAATELLYDMSASGGDTLRDVSGQGHDGKIHNARWVKR